MRRSRVQVTQAAPFFSPDRLTALCGCQSILHADEDDASDLGDRVHDDIQPQHDDGDQQGGELEKEFSRQPVFHGRFLDIDRKGHGGVLGIGVVLRNSTRSESWRVVVRVLLCILGSGGTTEIW